MIVKCPTCKGSGRVTIKTSDGKEATVDCLECGGSGQVETD